MSMHASNASGRRALVPEHFQKYCSHSAELFNAVLGFGFRLRRGYGGQVVSAQSQVFSNLLFRQSRARAKKSSLRNGCSIFSKTLVITWLIIALSNIFAVAAETNQVRRVIREYALTSANDFPERDPQDWRLIGSNDGGQTWTLLDLRRGEIFASRHQRRLFVVTNSAPFNLYRLVIDAARAPSKADAVQLAEIEPLNPDALPIFCDAISAQGQNSPAETAYQAFDDRVDTKWLDFAYPHPVTRSSWIQWRYLDHSQLVITNLAQLHSLRARAAEGYPIRLEAALADSAPTNGQQCLIDSTGFIDTDLPGPAREVPPGQKVLLQGASQWIDGRVTVANPQVQMLDSRAPSEPMRIAIEDPIAESDEFRWVEVEGQIQFLTQLGETSTFDLVDGGRHHSVRVQHWGNSRKTLTENSYVRVRGLCGGTLNQDGIRVAGVVWVSSMDSISTPEVSADNTLPAGKQPSNPLPPGYVLTQIDQIRRLSWADLSTMPKVKIRGVITDPAGTCIQDGTGGIEISFAQGNNRMAQGLGMYVEVEGEAIVVPGHGPTGTGPVIRPRTFVCLVPENCRTRCDLRGAS